MRPMAETFWLLACLVEEYTFIYETGGRDFWLLVCLVEE